jgi:hypothetical protein
VRGEPMVAPVVPLRRRRPLRPLEISSDASGLKVEKLGCEGKPPRPPEPLMKMRVRLATSKT